VSADPLGAWIALSRSALVGSERSAALAALPELLEGIPAPTGEVESQVLTQAAMLSPLIRAAFEPVPFEGRVPEEAGTDGTLSPAAGHSLSRLLEAGDSALVAEWCRAARSGQRRVADHLLPDFLDAMAKERQRELLDAMREVLGVRGTWLAAQNSQWSGCVVPGAAQHLEEAWRTGNPAQRLEALRAIRTAAPARARELLAATAATESPEELARFIAVLSVELGKDDHDFLEACLDAKLKAVRVAAAGLLARIPGAARSERNIARVASLLSFTLPARGKPAIAITLPEKLDPAEVKALTRDGIDTQKKRGSMGYKAVMLSQIVAGTPLGWFETAWSATPSQVLDAALDSDFSEALVTGLAEGAIVQQAGSWALPLMERFLGRAGGIAASIEGGIVPVFRLLSPADREALILARLEERPRSVHDGITLDLLGAMDHAWSSEFTRAFVDVARAYYLFETPWALRAALVRAAARMHPDAVDFATAGWPEDKAQWTDGDSTMIRTLRTTLELRQAYLRELKP
jgi:hypothetical protein